MLERPSEPPNEMNENDLLQSVARGERAAFETLFVRYQPQVSRFVSRMTRRHDLVEEIVNDTMMVVWQKADSFRGDSRPSSWILGIAYRTALKRLGRLQRRPEDELTESVVPVDPEEPELILSRAEGQREVHLALERLSPEHRAVIELTFFHGLSYREIARVVDCPENTVKTRMFHARKRLKRVLVALRGTPRRRTS